MGFNQFDSLDLKKIRISQRNEENRDFFAKTTSIKSRTSQFDNFSSIKQNSCIEFEDQAPSEATSLFGEEILKSISRKKTQIYFRKTGEQL